MLYQRWQRLGAKLREPGQLLRHLNRIIFLSLSIYICISLSLYIYIYIYTYLDMCAKADTYRFSFNSDTYR